MSEYQRHGGILFGKSWSAIQQGQQKGDKQICTNLPNSVFYGGILVDEVNLSEHFSVLSSGHIQSFVDLGEFTKPDDRYQQYDHGMIVCAFSGEVEPD